MRKRVKEKRETKIFLTIIVFSIFIITGLFIFSNWKVAQRRKELLKQIEALGDEIEMLEQKNQQLKQGIDQAEKESFWETKIREQGYQKPGETAVVIKKEEEAPETQLAPKNIWDKFLAEIGKILK